jgi:hypothetical protein
MSAVFMVAMILPSRNGISLFLDIVDGILRIPVGHSLEAFFSGSIDSLSNYLKHSRISSLSSIGRLYASTRKEDNPSPLPARFRFCQHRTLMPLEKCGRILLKLPIRYSAVGTYTDKPFVPQPSCRAAVHGIADHKFFVAVGLQAGPVTNDLYRPNPMELSCPGWP